MALCALKKLQLKRKTLAEQVGVNGSTLSNYFNGKLGAKGTVNMETRLSAWLKDNVAGSLHKIELRRLMADMLPAVEWLADTRPVEEFVKLS